jgi:hypothetical protein
MKSLRFSDIAILSTKERRARRIEFDQGSNLILGLNHTGKSTVTKMLFETLGASPTGKLEGWDTNAITRVAFTVDGVVYSVLRQGDRRALFDANGQLITATTRARLWTNAFNGITGFNLALTDKNENNASADPSCFFLPFYINQDGSWGNTWNTFKNLSRFKTPVKSILDYFSQITPPEYYRAKSAKDSLSNALAENDRELNALRRAKAKVAEALPTVGPKISSADFENEITRLTLAVNGLNIEQESLRLAALKENELLSIVRREIAVAERTLADYRQDAQFLDRRGINDLICPICGAEHSDSFLGTLEYVEDARALESTILHLKASEARLIEQVSKSTDVRRNLETQYNELDDILRVKKGEMQFRDVVKSLGAGSALDAFLAQEDDLEGNAQTLLGQIHELEQTMKGLIDKKRNKEIRQRFRDAYTNARTALNLPSVDASKQQIHARPDLSGSGGPRAILAYYAAIWMICSPSGQETYDPPSIPLVIDCPNQQGQDAQNLPRIIEFLSSRLPASAQVIVTFEGDVPNKFDRRIELTQPRQLLSEAEFPNLFGELDGMLAIMNDALLRI